MKVQVSNHIPEEDFSREFINTLMFQLKEATSLNKEGFEIMAKSAKPHWTGGRGHATEDEMVVAKKLTKQLLRYLDTPYKPSFPTMDTYAIKFSMDKDTPEEYDPWIRMGNF